MSTISPGTPGVYRSRSSTTRRRVLTAAAGLALLLLGYIIGRLQGGGTPAAGAPPLPAPSASTASSAPPEPSSAPPSSAAPSAPAGVDAYAPIQAESAGGQQGTQTQETEDEGGGLNVGWISSGDWLRFDDVDFGATPATRLLARVASDSDHGGRMEVRVDTPSNPPIATLAIDDTGGWQNWRTDSAPVTPTSGVHTVFVTFGNDSGDEFVNLNYFSFAH